LEALQHLGLSETRPVVLNEIITAMLRAKQAGAIGHVLKVIETYEATREIEGGVLTEAEPQAVLKDAFKALRQLGGPAEELHHFFAAHLERKYGKARKEALRSLLQVASRGTGEVRDEKALAVVERIKSDPEEFAFFYEVLRECRFGSPAES
jgi:hypothetical protein